MQHDLSRVSPSGFQNLSAALAVAAFGPQIQAMGPGPDGGRDMICQGALVWKGADDEPAETWNGYTVFQAKHKLHLSDRQTDNATWLWGEVRKDLEKWADPESGRDPVPDYLVIVTNVPLTPVTGTGGFDGLNARINGYIDAYSDPSYDVGDGAVRKEKYRRLRRIRKWRVWDGNQIDVLLTRHASVRRAFAAFLTAPDVFAHLAEFTDSLPVNDLEPGLRNHARTALTGDRAIYFDEAGSSEGRGTPVDQVAIDLPIAPGPDGEQRTVFRYILDRGEQVLRPKLIPHVQQRRHIVVAGGPGNGKTTMAKFLIQVYRAALLAGADNLATEHQNTIEATTTRLHDLGRDGLPRFRRWPMRIDLAEYAEEQGLKEDSTLLRWIAHKVSQRSNAGTVTASALDSWMKQWPWFLVLDGLDEVTEPRTRQRLIAQINEFVHDADGDNCDILVVVTTRPTGYREDIAPTYFERIDLSRLSISQAVAYGIHSAQVRLNGDDEKVERISKQLKKASKNESLQYLMQTPLQVLIMTIIVEGAGQLAPDRYSLFWGYYDTVFKRERSKPTTLARLLQEHSQTILTLHQSVGFELQVSSERDITTALMTPTELRQVARRILLDEGFQPADRDSDLLERIVTAATHRLVLLTPISRGHEGLGFDVRSLQELMAARFLTTGPVSDVIARLTIAAANPHWRNTWIFATGRLFADAQPHLQQAIVSLVEQIDRDAAQRLGRVCPIAPELSLDLIDDGMTRAFPKFHDRLLTTAFDILRAPRLADPLGVARVLVRAAIINDHVRSTIAEALRAALSDIPLVRESALAIQGHIGTAADEAKASPAVRGLAGVRGAPVGKQLTVTADQAWQQYREVMTEFIEQSTHPEVLEQADLSIRSVAQAGPIGVDVSAIFEALCTPGDAEILEMALEYLVNHEPELMELLRNFVLPTIHRSPVGELLRSTSA
ncbi:NACHT domain-containing protein [Nocardia cyriacigeorgica]|uniref:NACHT domain-containing protein n=1 Tax=Nocardia cyriacigeorgica TaxID=135487 RepID=UPI001E4E3E71|nr:hypothetical protein [Nocardia cyriacigeorgica]